ncbi:MAG: ATP-binding protein [Chloroflexi bacterium]|nr:ATP-binding protein [Chloroflexota bacterium]
MALMTSFVGRQQELDVLHKALDYAFEGRGGLCMLVGEAGIGKTGIAREFARYACQCGAMALWGSCLEGDWQRPYGPWIEALGGYVQAADPGDLRRYLGPKAATVAQLLPEVRLVFPDTPAPTPLSPDEERFRLYDAAIQFLLSLAKEHCAVLILDDLHWADRDSLLLLRYAARFLSRARLLVVGDPM